MATKNETFQRVWHLYEQEHGHVPASAREAVVWGHGKGLIALPEIDPFDVLSGEMARALREEYGVDEHGRRYRLSHAVHVTKGGVQFTFWATMGFAPRAHMHRAFALRREQVVSDCVQLKTDIDVYNDMNKSEPSIQLVLDFTADVDERTAWRARPRRHAA